MMNMKSRTSGIKNNKILCSSVCGTLYTNVTQTQTTMNYDAAKHVLPEWFNEGLFVELH